jgi:hypothetical protein
MWGSYPNSTIRIHTALEPVADPDGPDRGTDEDQYPEVTHQVDVNQHGCGTYQGGRPEDVPRRVVDSVGDGGGTGAARVDTHVPEEETRRREGPLEQLEE